MFAHHPSITAMPAPDDIVWRYMDVSRFLSLLEDEALAFAAAAEMSDRWEGVPTRVHPTFDDPTTNVRVTPKMTRNLMQATTFLNCWHVSNVESAAMWDIYQREGRGVAIKTTWARLTSALTTSQEIYGGLITYLDYATEEVPADNWIPAYMHKRRSFQHEREARLVIIDPHGFDAVSYDAGKHMGFGKFDDGEPPTVLAIPVNLRKLIDSVYVAPATPKWHADLVTKLVARYGHTFNVVRSDLDRAPEIGL